MRIERRFTKDGQSAYAEIEFRKALSEIKNPDGSVVFRLDGIDQPLFADLSVNDMAEFTPRPGDTLRVSLPPDRLRVFEP